MRLGDLDALKEKFDDYIKANPNISGVFELGKFIIDNAPTVEPCYQTTSCLDCKMYDKEKHNCPRFCEIIRSAIEEKPQDECKGGFQLTELRRWLTSQGYSEGTVDDKINEFARFVEKIRGEE